MIRIATRILGTITLGGIGGILMVGFVLPSLKDTAIVRHVSFLHSLAEGTTFIEHTEQLVVNEDSALEAAVRNAQKNVVEVQVTEKNIVATQTGLVLTNDGILVFPADTNQTASAQYAVRGSGADWSPATFLANSPTLGLVLVRAQDVHLTPALFGDVQALGLGQRIFALGISPDGRNFAAEGIVTAIATPQQNGQTSLRLEAQQGNGTGLFSLEGNMFGMFVTQHKTLSLISSSDIQAFLQSALATQ